MKILKDQPFWTSVILHLVVLLALVLVTIVQAFKPKEKPHVFEMVEPPSVLSQSQQTATPPPVKKASVKLPPVPKINTSKPPSNPQIIDYRDFTKDHPKDKPESRHVAQRPDIRVPQIDVPKLIIPRTSLSAIPSPQPSPEQMSALASYSSRLRSRIDAEWVKPAQRVGVRLLAEVVFDVSSSGQITNVRLLAGSGNAAFDQSILAAFRNASTAGPTPTGQSHQFSLPFQIGQ